jgi:hypothetical protein
VQNEPYVGLFVYQPVRRYLLNVVMSVVLVSLNELHQVSVSDASLVVYQVSQFLGKLRIIGELCIADVCVSIGELSVPFLLDLWSHSHVLARLSL